MEPAAEDLKKSDKRKELDFLAEAELIQKEEEQEYQEYLEAQRKRRERKLQENLKRREQRKRLLLASAVGLLVLIALIVKTSAVLHNPVVSRLTVEAGISELQASDFLLAEDSWREIEFVTDMSEISLDHVGTYEVVLYAKGKNRTSKLIVEDTVAPTVTTAAFTLNLNGEMTADELIEETLDATDVTYDFKDTPDFSSEGTVYVTVVATDEGGNTTEVTGVVTVMVDEEAPVIDGVAHISAFIDVPVSYKSTVTVTDNCDANVKLEVDTSAVNATEEGTYTVVYSATDRAGNTTSESATITFTEKPDDYIDEETVLEEAQEVLDEILTDDMTLKQKAKAIYEWVRNNVGYTSSTYKESWTNGAHIGFTTGSGDCYIFFATAKALLTQAGIPNIDIEKSNTAKSHHYWSLVNVGDGWYHFDTTPRKSGATFFLVTDAEMLAYFESNGIYNAFDTSLYPATPTTASTID